MKLYYWTECEYDECHHYMAFAETEADARKMVEDGTRGSWPDHCHDASCEELEAFANGRNISGDPLWKLEVFDIKMGLVKA